MKKLFATLGMVLSLALTASAIVPSPAGAASLPAPVTQFAACDPGTFFGFPSWYACLPKDSTGHPQLSKMEDLWLIAIPLLETMIKAAAYVAVAFVIWGAILFIKSQGNPGNITAARDTIRDAAIGLILCISSVAIVQFVASRL